MPLGNNYVEHGCIRLDGEDATNNDLAVNSVSVHRDDTFEGWDGWKRDNKKGFECEVNVTRRKNRIILETANCGIHLKSTTTVATGNNDVYMCLTGDQCVVTDVRVLT